MGYLSHTAPKFELGVSSVRSIKLHQKILAVGITEHSQKLDMQHNCPIIMMEFGGKQPLFSVYQGFLRVFLGKGKRRIAAAKSSRDSLRLPFSAHICDRLEKALAKVGFKRIASL